MRRVSMPEEGEIERSGWVVVSLFDVEELPLLSHSQPMHKRPKLRHVESLRLLQGSAAVAGFQFSTGGGRERREEGDE
eukprot:483802-Hanusia_phi.AAC.1